jgi:hypothetical protein
MFSHVAEVSAGNAAALVGKRGRGAISHPSRIRQTAEEISKR